MVFKNSQSDSGKVMIERSIKKEEKLTSAEKSIPYMMHVWMSFIFPWQLKKS